MTKPTVSLIISTYNWPQALNLVMKSVQNQSKLPDDIIISDDGSDSETADLIQELQSDFPIPIIHVWHEDRGFRLAAIRNKAIAKSTADYIIQSDGDALLHPHYVADHLRLAEKDAFISGSRVLLNEASSNRALAQAIYAFHWWSSGIKNRWNATRNDVLVKLNMRAIADSGQAAYKVRGCNMSFWKSDLIRVNGYDENMTGWGREDSELAVRLVNAGVQLKRIKHAGIQFHLYHEEAPRTGLNRNDEILEESIEQKKIFCDRGLSTYL